MTAAATTTTIVAPTTSAAPATNASTTAAPTTTVAPAPYAAIAGQYVGSTGSSGTLSISGTDGASRFSQPDSTACPSCSTATAPMATVDFRINSIVNLGDPDANRATGVITAESDPADARTIAGPVGSTVVVRTFPPKDLTLSFLPVSDVLHRL